VPGAPAAELGEGPVWRDGALLWLDITGCALHRTTADGATTTTALPEQVGAIAPSETYGLVAAAESGFAGLDPATGALTPLAPAGLPAAGMRMNDGKCDRAGRFWASTMEQDGAPGRGALWVLEPAGAARRVLDGLAIGNGLGWTADDRTFYFIDTPTGRVDAFAYDLATGTPTERRPFVSIEGDPDGLTVDAEDAVWVALFGGGAVHRYLPDGTLDVVVEVPARHVTSCAFGDGGDLWVTTAGDGLFRVGTGTRGRPPYAFGR
jgi:sugar lactone lactonase YvrE